MLLVNAGCVCVCILLVLQDGNFSLFTTGTAALVASCHVIRVSPRGLDQTPVARKQGGGGLDLSLKTEARPRLTC